MNKLKSKIKKKSLQDESFSVFIAFGQNELIALTKTY